MATTKVGINFLRPEAGLNFTIYIQQLPKAGETIIGGIKIPVILNGGWSQLESVPQVTGLTTLPQTNPGKKVAILVIALLTIIGAFAIWKVIKWQ